MTRGFKSLLIVTRCDKQLHTVTRGFKSLLIVTRRDKQLHSVTRGLKSLLSVTRSDKQLHIVTRGFKSLLIVTRRDKQLHSVTRRFKSLLIKNSYTLSQNITNSYTPSCKMLDVTNSNTPSQEVTIFPCLIIFNFLYFILVILHYYTQKENKIKTEPRIKLNDKMFQTVTQNSDTPSQDVRRDVTNTYTISDKMLQLHTTTRCHKYFYP